MDRIHESEITFIGVKRPPPVSPEAVDGVVVGEEAVGAEAERVRQEFVGGGPARRQEGARRGVVGAAPSGGVLVGRGKVGQWKVLSFVMSQINCDT